jgi:hypothetical protein
LAAAPSWADAGGQKVPYRGRLERNGSLVSGAHDFWFKMFSSSSAVPNADPASAADGSVWREEQRGILVAAGTFTVELGAAQPLTAGVWGNKELFLAIYVRTQGEPNYALLQGLHPILPVPMSVRTERAQGIYMPGGSEPDGTFVGAPGNFVSFGHAGTSEDFIGYKSNTFYLRDSTGGGDTSQPHLDVGGNVVVGGKLEVQGFSGMVPVGGIVDWWRPSGSTLAVPENFKVCDGSVVSDSRSPFNGKNLPNLVDRFTRGTATASQLGATGGTLTHQHDAAGAHFHRQTGGDIRATLSGGYPAAEQGFNTEQNGEHQHPAASHLPPFTSVYKVIRIW